LSKFDYTEEMVTQMQSACASGVTETIIESLVEEFEFPRRSVTAKLRKLGFDVPKKPGQAPVFSADETAALTEFLDSNSGVFTAEEIAAQFSDGNFNARQINGKALSLEMTDRIKPAEKKVVPRSYTEEQEDTINTMVSDGAYLEDIASSLDKPLNSVRGKLLSMGLKAPQREKSTAKNDAYDGIAEVCEDMTVEELAAHFDKSARGVKTVLTRRHLVCKDYTPSASKSDD